MNERILKLIAHLRGEGYATLSDEAIIERALLDKILEISSLENMAKKLKEATDAIVPANKQ